ncbi:hypothetical protein [Mailhella massiliensis]|uniref:hypothetical protein n=1 Tax=Mailhella massiliensis TaxID=1903261 RepID=UPI00097E15CD|nr:hypothetical protein [Mailhella massiliensis]
MSTDIKISQSVPSAGGDTSPSGERAPLAAPDDRLSALFRKSMEERPGRHDLESGRSQKDDRLSGLFSRSAEKKPERHGQDGGRTASEGRENSGEAPQSATASMAGMTSPLDSLFSGRMEQAAPAAEPAPDGPDLEKLVERILVSTPEKGGHEVRLSLGGRDFQGTDIVLRRGVDGILQVSVRCTDPSAFQTMVSSQDALRAGLERMEKSDVRVDVSREADREENDAGRRSRGYMAEDTNHF